MDSFSTISFFSKTSDVATQPPVDQEGGGGAGNGYCVVSREVTEQTLVNEEGGGGAGNGYCVIA
jgi:hypothetical protein